MMTEMTILINVDQLHCPGCLERRLFEYSTLAPVLVKCGACGCVHQLAFVQGYWMGYQSAKENGHNEHDQAEISLNSAGR